MNPDPTVPAAGPWKSMESAPKGPPNKYGEGPSVFLLVEDTNRSHYVEIGYWSSDYNHWLSESDPDGYLDNVAIAWAEIYYPEG